MGLFSDADAPVADQDSAGLDASRSILLVGNPNVGKSVLFKNLTSQYVTVSNYPGTTVEVVRAKMTAGGAAWQEVIDSPGINDLSARSEDARVTVRLFEEHPDATIVQVADAKNLRRALLLTLQLAELGRPMVLVLNMLDEMRERGGKIDTDGLSSLLGVPVVTTVALRNEGTDQLVRALPEASAPDLSIIPDGVNGDIFGRNKLRLSKVNELVAQTYTIEQPERATLRVRLGFWAMHPFKGLALLGVVLVAVFWFVGLFGAGTLVDLFEVGGFQQNLSPLAIRAVDVVLPFPHAHADELVSHPVALPVTPIHEIIVGNLSKTVVGPEYTVSNGISLSPFQEVLRFLHDFLVGKYGAITMAFSYAFAIVLPIVTTFFLVFSVMEDSGYLPRMAIMANKSFKIMGLNGKAVLPMILGLGCATMATMTTRILETRKERVVTSMLLALAIPCSAQLGVLLAMMATLSPVGAVLWLGILLAVLLLVGWLTSRIFGGQTSNFILEIPPMRWPQPSNVLVKTASRIKWYLIEVIPLFLAGTALLFILDKLDALAAIARVAEPLVSGWLGLPAEMADAFLVGFLRRDFGAVYILDAVIGSEPLLTPHQIFVAMVTITLFMPCIANFLMVSKEHGMRVAWRMAAFIFPFAFLVGGILNHLLQWFPIL